MTDAEAREMQLLRNALKALTDSVSYLSWSHDGETVTIKMSRAEWEQINQTRLAARAALRGCLQVKIRLEEVRGHLEEFRRLYDELTTQMLDEEDELRRQYESRAKQKKETK